MLPECSLKHCGQQFRNSGMVQRRCKFVTDRHMDNDQLVNNKISNIYLFSHDRKPSWSTNIRHI